MADDDVIERLEATEHKVRGIEDLAFSFADTINTRTARYDAEFAEIRSRLNLLDRAVTMLQTDVRDLRAGVTAQLTAQDGRLAAMDDRLAAMDDRLAAVDDRLTAMDSRLAAIDNRLTAMDDRLSLMDGKLDLILAKLGP